MDRAVHSSTSSSEGGARLRRDGLPPLLSLGVFALLGLGGAWLRVQPGWGELVPLVAAAERPGPGWYLAYDRGGLDHGVLYHDLSGAAEALRSAEVLFLGDSSVQFAFPHGPLAEFSARTGLRAFVMAFAYGEHDEFAEALIERHDLHPKWLVVNADPFFVGQQSDMARHVRAGDAFEAWKERFQAVTAYEVRHRLHQVVPYLDPFPPARDWVNFRNLEDGTLHVAAWAGTPRPATSLREGLLRRAKPEWIRRAERFQQDMRARGARLVLTTIPPVSPNLALDLSEALAVPVVLPPVPREELMTLDGNHLDQASSLRYATAFLAQLERVLRGEELPRPERER